MPERLTPARFVALHELGATPEILVLRTGLADQRRTEWLIGAGLVRRCETPEDDYPPFRVTEAGLAAVREHLDYLEERDRAGLPHRSGNEYGIQRSVPWARARLDAALAWREQGLAPPPAGPAIAAWRFGQAMSAWQGSPPAVLEAVAVLRAAGHMPVLFVGGEHEAGAPEGFYVEPRTECLFVYHVEEGRSARADGTWFSERVGAYAEALREAGWHAEPPASRCAVVRAPGAGGAGVSA